MYRFIISSATDIRSRRLLSHARWLTIHAPRYTYSVNNGLELIRHHCYTAYGTPVFSHSFIHSIKNQHWVSSIARICLCVCVCECENRQIQITSTKIHIAHLELGCFSWVGLHLKITMKTKLYSHIENDHIDCQIAILCQDKQTYKHLLKDNSESFKLQGKELYTWVFVISHFTLRF